MVSVDEEAIPCSVLDNGRTHWTHYYFSKLENVVWLSQNWSFIYKRSQSGPMEMRSRDLLG